MLCIVREISETSRIYRKVNFPNDERKKNRKKEFPTGFDNYEIPKVQSRSQL